MSADAHTERTTRAGGPELVSIVVPSFNQARWLGACLESLFAQGDPNLEVIVVDGGSTDGTRSVLDAWRPRLSACISERDEGHAHALEKGFAIARGAIQAWLNSDDLHMPWTIARWREAFARDPRLEMVHGDRIVIDADGRVTGYRLLPGHSRYWLNRFPWTHQETAAWRRTLYDRVGGIDRSLRFAMDFDLFARFFEQGRCAHLRSFLGAFRWHGDSKSARIQATVGAADMRLVRARLGVASHPRLSPLRVAMGLAVRARTRLHALAPHRPPERPTRTGLHVSELWPPELREPVRRLW